MKLPIISQTNSKNSFKKAYSKILVKPLSVNDAWQGRRFKTSEYKQYENDCLWQKIPLVKGEVEIHYTFHLKRYSTSDVDNFIKPLQDILVKMGAIEDDKKVVRIVAEKVKDEKEFTEVEIKQCVDKAL